MIYLNRRGKCEQIDDEFKESMRDLKESLKDMLEDLHDMFNDIREDLHEIFTSSFDFREGDHDH